MKTLGPFVTDNGGYIDALFYVTVGNKEWKFPRSLDLEDGHFYDGNVEVADAPDGCFGDADMPPPGVAIRAFEAQKTRIDRLMLEKLPSKVFSIKFGVATMVHGITVDLKWIQGLLNEAYMAYGAPDLAKAANQMALLTGMRQGPHEEWYLTKEET